MASARMMGTGKLQSRLNTLNLMVLPIILPKVGAEKKRSNHSKPTHLLPKKPFAAL